MEADPVKRLSFSQDSASSSRRVLFVVAILASAFLIFLVQPMVGKRILPWFGGVPSVWTLCLAFYQTTLFFGYAYAHLLVRFATPKLQLGIHAIFIVAALAAMPVLPGDTWKPIGQAASPSLYIFQMLTSNVALPFLVLHRLALSFRRGLRVPTRIDRPIPSTRYRISVRSRPCLPTPFCWSRACPSPQRERSGPTPSRPRLQLSFVVPGSQSAHP